MPGARQTQLVFIHGLFSNSEVWTEFESLLADDDFSNSIKIHKMQYASPKFRMKPTKNIPDFADLGKQLRTFLDNLTPFSNTGSIVIVTHSQGGLVAQSYLAQLVQDDTDPNPHRISCIVMFGCPNTGSLLLLSARKWLRFWNHRQERHLRPVDEQVTAFRNVVFNRIVHASVDSGWRVPIFSYAGDSDGVVPPVSAIDLFPASQSGVVQGDHQTIVRPQSRDSDPYRTLARHLAEVISLNTSEDNWEELRDGVPTTSEEDAIAALDEAIRLADRGEIDQADYHYRIAISHNSTAALESYSHFKRRNGEIHESIKLVERVIEQIAAQVESSKNRIHRCRALASKGVSLRYVGRYHDSEISLRQAVIAIEQVDPLDRSDAARAHVYALDNLGLTQMRTSPTVARQTFEESHRIRSRDQIDGEAYCDLNFATLEFHHGKLELARTRAEKALADTAPPVQARALSLISEIHLAQGDVAKALQFAASAHSINQDIGRQIATALTLQLTARCQLRAGLVVAAEKSNNDAQSLFLKGSNSRGEITCKATDASIDQARGDHAKAEMKLVECATRFAFEGLSVDEAWCHFYLGISYHELGQIAASSARIRRAEQMSSELEIPRLMVEIHRFRGHQK